MISLFLCITNIICLILNINVSNYMIAIINVIAIIMCGSYALISLREK